jgi:hypothetical protein
VIHHRNDAVALAAALFLILFVLILDTPAY